MSESRSEFMMRLYTTVVMNDKVIKDEDLFFINSNKYDFLEHMDFRSNNDCVHKGLRFIRKYYRETLKRVDGAKKSNPISESMREKANTLFKEKKWFAALKFYSKSIALADPGSIELGYAYANRSALLMHRGFYKECLEDIQRALEIKIYPEEKKTQLTLRQEKAKKALPNQQERVKLEDPPTIENSNPLLKGASDAIKLSENEEYGRYIEATRDIKIGEVILVENPFVFNVSYDRKTFYCGHCAQLCFNLIPCCTCSVEMYCSEKCKQEAYEEYHQYECVIYNFQQKDLFEVSEDTEETTVNLNLEASRLLALRLTLKGYRKYRTSNPSDVAGIYDQLSTLVTHSDDLSKTAKLILALNVAKQFFILDKHTDFFNQFNDEDAKVLFKDHLLRNRMITLYNSTCFTHRIQLLENGRESLNTGCGIFPTYAMFNHSCLENTGYGCYGSTLVVRATRTIKKGEQCFANYGLYYQEHPKPSRRIESESMYFFSCKCRACIENWPTCDDIEDDNEEHIGDTVHIAFLFKVLLEEDHLDESKRQALYEHAGTLKNSVCLDKPSVNLIAFSALMNSIASTRYLAELF